MNEWMNVSVYYKIPTIYFDNIVAIIFQKTINLFCQGRGKCLQLVYHWSSTIFQYVPFDRVVHFIYNFI